MNELEASVTKVCPDGVNGTVENGQCIADASVIVQNNLWGDFRLLYYDIRAASPGSSTVYSNIYNFSVMDYMGGW